MKTKLLSFILIICFGLALKAQQKVDDNLYNKRLFYLCKVWGYAKHYHTEIAKGTVA